MFVLFIHCPVFHQWCSQKPANYVNSLCMGNNGSMRKKCFGWLSNFSRFGTTLRTSGAKGQYLCLTLQAYTQMKQSQSNFATTTCNNATIQVAYLCEQLFHLRLAGWLAILGTEASSSSESSAFVGLNLSSYRSCLLCTRPNI